LVFLGLAFVAERYRERLLKGDILLGYLIGYPLGRFFIEYLRPDAWMIGPLAAAQWFAIICVVGGVVLLIVRHQRADQVSPALSPVEEAAESDAESSEEPVEA
jgi:phosphatidylglycerol:prolipoprotein diacylglycerol transferase